ncbi:MAG: urease accessory protein UreE [Methylophilaceae bacterium]|nr:urease accessory protein UreE [Methylophilaceae bacterium]
MLNITERITNAAAVDDQLELPFDLRQKSRLRVTLQSGQEAALLLDRGIILRGGDLLRAENGLVIEIIAAEQPVQDVLAQNPHALMCAAYHLGNRHVPLQIGDDWLRLEQDHVLKEMLLGLGMTITEKYAPFEPEAGAYGGGHRHQHDDGLPIRQPARLRKHA